MYSMMLREVKTSSGKRALLISMQDGGRGGEYVAVADPMRGEAFFPPDAEIVGHQGDRIKLGFVSNRRRQVSVTLSLTRLCNTI